MGNQNARMSSYYEAIQNQHAVVDPYEVLGVPKNFTWEELKVAYRNVAKLVHPDKGGNEQMFQTVTQCFKELADVYKSREANKPHHVLRQESKEYYEKHHVQHRVPREEPGPGPGPGIRPEEDAKKFNIDRFNQVFEDNRFDDEYQHGYGNMMEKSSKKRDDISIAQTIDSYDKDKFNEQFNSKADPSALDVTVYREPEPLELARKIAYTELGVTKIDDFSSVNEDRRNLQYTDYKKAHTFTRLIDPSLVDSQKQYKNVKEYETARKEVVKKSLTEEEKRYHQERDQKALDDEAKRNQTLRDRDQSISDHYNKMSQLLLGSSGSQRSKRL